MEYLWDNIKKYYKPIIIVIILVIAVIVTYACRKQQTGLKVVNPDNEKVLFSQLSLDGKSMYYFSQNKKYLKKWDLEKNKTENWLELNFDTVDRITYAPDMEKALVHWSNPENAFDAHTLLISLNDKKPENELSTNILNAAWSADSSKIAYHYFDWDNNINNISISDPDGSNAEKILDTKIDDLGFAWTDENTLIYYSIPSEISTTELNNLDINSKNSSVIASDIYINNIKSVNNQKKALLDIANDENSFYKLNVYDSKTKKLTALDLATTVAQTGQVADTSILYTAYRPSSTSSSDQLEKIDLSSNKIDKIDLKLNQIIKTEALFPTSDGKTLYIVSDGDLYKIILQ